mgnify:CR=1 FL=1
MNDIIRATDTKGPYYKWGRTGKKYYYVSNNKRSRELARSKALKQRTAANAAWASK